jgi:hypothetical protein
MQTGYVLCSPDFDQVLSFNKDNTSVELIPVDSTVNINKSICLSDLTEAKNVLKRFNDCGFTSGLEIANVARLYKKFY